MLERPGSILLAWHGLNSTSALANNNIHYKVWDEITHLFPNFNGTAIDVWESHTLMIYDYLIMLGFKLIHVSKGAHETFFQIEC